ncbi:MAG: 4-hydroxy-tetrahydrodipicolinate reductase [Myxococcaceae bacterium]|nr:4-hydroxy-tetrahydrodipicolinate reductase [Myxococcaceae bacterium]
MAELGVVITGVTGRMGSALVKGVRDTKGLVLAGATERPGSTAVGLDAGLAAHLGMLEVSVEDSLQAALTPRANVVIDFTSPEASLRHAAACAAARVPLVVGSTGFTEAHKAELLVHAKSVAIVMSPNMSVGVNLMIAAAAQLAARLGEAFEVEIVEAHHRNKKDAPSGTALRLAEEIAKARGLPRSVIRTAREGQVGERSRQEIGVATVRGGDVVGEHTVFYLGDGERLELSHRASSREQFVRGALRAAAWAVGKPPGLYGMTDVLA